MKVLNTKLGRIFGTGALLASLVGAQGCDEAAKACGLTCPDTGVLEGNASITGFGGIDAFFQSVVSFRNVAAGVTADIQAELDGIQGAFGISNADLTAAGGKLGAAIKAKLGTVKLKVDAQPAKCEVDASLTIEAKAECSVKAGCTVDKGELSVSCMGTCEVDVNASGSCEAEAKLTCEVTAPSISCSGECQGSCELDVAADGMCNGECSVALDSAGKCAGKCTVSGMAALNCQGSCTGTCVTQPASASCDASAKAHCEFEAKAEAKCTGKCEGEFEPPKVDCDAEASCDASAKADAKFQAKCTPPSLDVRVEGGAEVSAQLKFAINDLKVRLPRLLAAIKKAELVAEAGLDLGKDGAAAVQGSLSAFTEGKVDVVAAYRISACAPAELTDSAKAISDASTGLTAQVAAAGEVAGSIGM
jgi:hypothetical protein